MAVTLKDISERTGKSIPTVSRALAGFADISLQTRQQIQNVAREMGYEPNAAARSLQKKRTDVLALILPATHNLRFSDPFFSEFLSGVIERAALCGFDVNITTDAMQDEHAAYLKHIRRRSADGFIIVRTRRKDARISLLQEHNYPFVAFGRVEGENDFPLVDEDGAAGIRQVIDHLVTLGHTRLACITEPLALTKSYLRLQGYLEGLQRNNIPVDPDLIIESNFRQRSGRISALQLLDLPDPPTAIVACNDLLALGAAGAAQERGLVVGRDISIAGFDDIVLAELANPPLTTVHQPAHQMGALVAEMLCKVVTGQPVEEKQLILQPALVIRKSTGPRL